jgi:hypothetical protein
MNLNFIQRLPKDIISRIIPYTYRHPSKQLLRDIEDYNASKVRLLDLYRTYWRYYENEEYKHWVVNDLLAYANHYKPTMHGYVNHFYRIFNKNLLPIETYLTQLRHKKVDAQINTLLGRFNIHERRDLVKECSLRLNLN